MKGVSARAGREQNPTETGSPCQSRLLHLWDEHPGPALGEAAGSPRHVPNFPDQKGSSAPRGSLFQGTPGLDGCCGDERSREMLRPDSDRLSSTFHSRRFFSLEM